MSAADMTDDVKLETADEVDSDELPDLPVSDKDGQIEPAAGFDNLGALATLVELKSYYHVEGVLRGKDGGIICSGAPSPRCAECSGPRDKSILCPIGKGGSKPAPGKQTVCQDGKSGVVVVRSMLLKRDSRYSGGELWDFKFADVSPERIAEALRRLEGKPEHGRKERRSSSGPRKPRGEVNPATGCRAGTVGDQCGVAILGAGKKGEKAILTAVSAVIKVSFASKGKDTSKERVERQAKSWIQYLRDLHPGLYRKVGK